MFGNRLSAVMVFAGQRASNPRGVPLFLGEAPVVGVVYRPPAGSGLLTCGYVNDGGTRGADKPDGCGPSRCPPGEGRRDGWCDGKPYEPEHFDILLRANAARGSYCEMIIDVAALDAILAVNASVVDAFFSMSSGGGTGSARGRARARAVHARFRQRFGGRALAGLMSLNTKNWTHPFADDV